MPGNRVWPAPLRAGDRVALVAPAGPAPVVELEAGTAVLEGWGLRVEPAFPPGEVHPRLRYLAADDAARAKQLQQAWCDPDIAAVICARGGYGALRMLDLVDWDAMAAAPSKIFAGSSDITALHAVLGRSCDVVTLFAPLTATGAMLDPDTQEHLRRALFDPPDVLHGAAQAETIIGGRATGRLVGGTLSLVVSTLGVPDVELPPDGAIVLLEDITERPYRIDQFLTHLLRAGWFDRVSGIVLGSWHKCGEPAEVHDVIVDRLGPLGVPLVEEFGFGHCPDARTMPLGAVAELDATARTLTIRR
ncbi:S66 peptidase family protein [Pseudonocardia sp. GCM10023141]|uniref:S66 peptidase family protein n=1 Tax=Pseudonocardia sp. GCM10023141 TaxID=3252653 RepID=UPI00360843EA